MDLIFISVFHIDLDLWSYSRWIMDYGLDLDPSGPSGHRKLFGEICPYFQDNSSFLFIMSYLNIIKQLYAYLIQGCPRGGIRGICPGLNYFFPVPPRVISRFFPRKLLVICKRLKEATAST